MTLFSTCWASSSRRLCLFRYTSSFSPRISFLSMSLPIMLFLVALSCTTIAHASVETTTLSAAVRTKTAGGESSGVASAVVVTTTTAHSTTATPVTTETTTTTGSSSSSSSSNIHTNVLSHVAARTPLLNIEGIELAHYKTVEGHRLFLNGAGIRAIRFMGMNFKVYVASLYVYPHPIDSVESIFNPFQNQNEINDNESYLYQMDFTFLRSVGQSKVTQAWREQLDYSVTYTYNGYENDRDIFISMFGPIENGGTETIQFNINTGDTIIYDQGIYKGTISSRNFQRAFLSVWFGEKAVSSDLKTGLLGKVVLDEKNILAVLRSAAAAAADSEGGGHYGDYHHHHHHHHPPLLHVVASNEEDKGSSVSSSAFTNTTTTATTMTTTVVVVEEE